MPRSGTQIDRWQSVAGRAARDALLRPVRRDLAEARIAPVVLKGDALARTLYRSDPERRPHVDLDWLAPPGQVEAVTGILRGHGWEPVPGAPNTFDFCGPVAARIDLHAELWFVPAHDRSSFESRCSELEDLHPLRAPSLCDHFITVAVHTVLGHAHFRPTWTEDLVRLYQAGVEVEPTLQRARDWGVAVPVRLAFEQVAARIADSDPVKQDLERSAVASHWFDRFREDLVRDLLCRPETPDVGHLLKWLYLRGVGARLAALKRHLVPDRRFLTSRYSDSSVSSSRLLRPLRTLAAGLRLGERLVCGSDGS